MSLMDIIDGVFYCLCGCMYLKSSSFSNLLSFSAHDHSDLRHTIVRSGGDEDRVNIVIGPNGS